MENTLATVPISNGVAQLVTTLAAGSNVLVTAIYSGDANFTTSTSSNSVTVVVAPLDFSFTDTGVSTYTVAPGAIATYSFALSPLYGSYAGPMSFTVTGLPPGAVVHFTTGPVAAGGTSSVVMTVQTSAPSAHNRNSFGGGMVLALLFLPFGFKRSLRKKLNARLLLLLLLMGAAATMSGCATGSGFLLQSPQSYTLTVTATAGSLVHSETVTLIVQ